ncbi:putative procollagen-proline 4-dioxygenase [Lupinus albus]|uniref:Putative procollagen-proline 4-dioxygenase n=1 Tax=Lupinus albus TaxID=3870 RepID=A0A6A4QFF0_LUPAL|nr:putative procollagen-proline 4-dioxygenase [Lupinus albus]
MKGKTVKRNWSGKTNTLSFSSVFLICIFFFVVGFFCSTRFFHSQKDENDIRPRPMTRLLEKSAKEETEYNLLRAGESGDDSITSIPFQVLSWRPRALYFPNFASSEQCKSIINMARRRLKPSALKLRKGETKESTQGIRTRKAFNVLRYEIGQRYASHYDTFNPAEYGPQESQRLSLS